MTEMLLSHADGEKLKDSFDFSHVGAFYCSISLRIRQGQAAYGGGCHCLWFKIEKQLCFESSGTRFVCFNRLRGLKRFENTDNNLPLRSIISA